MASRELNALESPEGLMEFCRERFEVDLKPSDATDFVSRFAERRYRYEQTSDGNIGWLMSRLRERGYFAWVGEVQDFRVFCILHWPWPAGLPIPSGYGDRQGDVARSKISKTALEVRPIDSTAKNVFDPGKH